MMWPVLLCDCQSFIKESYLLTYLLIAAQKMHTSRSITQLDNHIEKVIDSA